MIDLIFTPIFIIYGVILYKVGKQDFDGRDVNPELMIALLAMTLALCIWYQWIPFVFMVVFTLMYYANIWLHKSGKPTEYGWGDIIAYPTFFAMATAQYDMFLGMILAILPLLLTKRSHRMISPKDKNPGIPLMWYCFIVYLISFVITIVVF